MATAAVSGTGTTTNLVNYAGELIALTPEDAPLLSMAGGLFGYQTTTDPEFAWTTYDLRDASDSRQRLESGDSPTAEHRTRAQIKNVVELHTESIRITRTKQASIGKLAGLNTSSPATGGNPITDELGFQALAMTKAKKLDIEKSLFTGTFYSDPSEAAPRRTRGIIEATPDANIAISAASASKTGTATASGDTIDVTSNGYANGDLVAFSVLTGGTGLRKNFPYYVVNTATNTFKVSLTRGGAAVDVLTDYSAITVYKLAAATKADIDAWLQGLWESGGLNESETATLFVGGSFKRLLSKLYITDAGYQEQTRNVGGVDLQVINSDFGKLNVALSRYVPAGAAQAVSAEEMRLVVLPHEGRGFMYLEKQPVSGTKDEYMLAGEIGLKYGNPIKHGRLLALGL